MAGKKDNFLEYVPYINNKNSWSDDDGIVTVNMVHRGFYHKLAQFLAGTPKVSHIKLDKYGSFIWKNIDGEKSVYDIAGLFKAEFGEEAEPLYERIIKYFQILKHNRYVFFKKQH